jgi:hypothetical protein
MSPYSIQRKTQQTGGTGRIIDLWSKNMFHYKRDVLE